MCGLAFCLGRDHREKTEHMIKNLSHRGLADRVGFYSGHNYSLGHIRLPIQGLAQVFDQPYSRFTHKNKMVYVGEVFNFDQFIHNQSDVPIVYNIVHNGLIQAFDKLDGFWSIVYVNEDEKTAYVYTDHLAKKPLYILREEETVAICSEIIPLVLIAEELRWNHHDISVTGKWGYSPLNTTPFANIDKIPANTRFVLDLESHTTIETISPYLNFPKDPKLSLSGAMEQAVKNRLVSDIPISLLLSGGLDSTIVYQLVRKYTSDITIFHIDNDESEYLNYLDFKGVDVRQIQFNPEGNTSIVEALLSNQTPVDLGSMVQQFLLSKEISRHGRNVAISGDGADELFGGYRRAKLYDSQQSDIWDELVHYHLPRLDRQMMVHTVELRCPFLSPEVINYALTVPYEQRTSKQILKTTFANIVPRPILEREKVPLKIKQIRTDPLNWRLDLIEIFIREIGGIYERGRYQ